MKAKKGFQIYKTSMVNWYTNLHCKRKCFVGEGDIWSTLRQTKAGKTGPLQRIALKGVLFEGEAHWKKVQQKPNLPGHIAILITTEGPCSLTLVHASHQHPKPKPHHSIPNGLHSL